MSSESPLPNLQADNPLLNGSTREQLARHRQQHVLRFWDDLDPASRQRLAEQLNEVDFDLVADLVAGSDEAVDFGAMAQRAVMPASVASDGSGVAWTIDQAKQRGEEALRAGEVACILVAGGQGTRLGFDQPKGMFPIGPVSGRTLFEIFADRLLAVGQHYDVKIPLYLMTSQATDGETRAYFESHDRLGLAEDQVTIFQQGTMPAVDAESGKLLLADKDSLALSPDGHGGTLRALVRNGCLDRMREQKIKHLFYFQVDNPLVTLCDPVFIGHHLLAESEMTTQVIRKRFPTEKVGNVVEVDGRTRIIEYSDLPESAAEMTDETGGLKLWAGSIAVHLFDVEFLHRVRDDAAALPFHRANKKVPHLNAEGERVEPSDPNAIKFERFIFDLLPSAARTIICEVEPSEAFAPVKNADGAATDTPALARQAISDYYIRWAEQAGVDVAPSVQLEVNPRFAIDQEAFAEKISGSETIAEDRYFSGS